MLSAKYNRSFAWWHHFTSTTIILQGFSSLCKWGPLILILNLIGITKLNRKEETKWTLVLVVKTHHHANGLFTIKLRNPWRSEIFQEWWLCSDQSQKRTGNASKSQIHRQIITIAVCSLVFSHKIVFFPWKHSSIPCI